ncbi:c-type cytochrome [Brevundimonas vesicularis]|uniref:c-type cytochrome n=1 Tax=Brevundimonas vesicularis TaxID=41276 RepID=UPI0038D4032A
MQSPILLGLVASGCLILAGCGDSGTGATSSESGAVAPPSAPALSDEEKLAVLASLPAPYNAADLDNGRRAFARCRSCHTITPGGPHLSGPNLHGVFDRRAGGLDKYSYSHALRNAGFDWDAAALDQWLQNPRDFLPGNKMTFAGLSKPEDRRDVIAFLKVETGYRPTQDGPAEQEPDAE